jgi:hypothetical protein
LGWQRPLGTLPYPQQDGGGSAGTVYLARDEAADRTVALKLIRRERLTPEGMEQLQHLCHRASG